MRRILARKPVATVAAAALTAVALTACSPEDAGGSEGGSEGAGGGDAYEELIGAGPVADDAAVEANEWASSVREAGVLEVGGTETSELFSLLDPTTGQA